MCAVKLKIVHIEDHINNNSSGEKQLRLYLQSQVQWRKESEHSRAA